MTFFIIKILLMTLSESFSPCHDVLQSTHGGSSKYGG